MKKPNFFIIGAPKCGTTSLAAWLAEHPQVYFSPYKEPHYFDTDHKKIIEIDISQYEKCFYGAHDRHQAIGEGSVWYLHSSLAVLNIEAYAPESKYIVCLRNPIEMAYSLHEQQVFNGNEHVKDFAEAWQLNDARLRGENIIDDSVEPMHLSYGTACLLGRQMQRLYQQVPRERVHVVLMDNLKVDPRKVYLNVLSFLGLYDDGRIDFSVKNSAKERKSMILKLAVKKLGNLKTRLGIQKRFGLLRAIDRKNVQYRPRVALPDDMKIKLKDYFKEDIKLLSTLIQRDLSHWSAK